MLKILRPLKSAVKNQLAQKTHLLFLDEDSGARQLESAKTTLPINLKPEDRNIFPATIFFASQDASKEYKNVNITRSGIAFKNFKLIRQSVHADYPDHVLHCYQYAIYSYFFKKKIKLTSEKCLVIHNHWSSGYYHWITEALPRLWILKGQLPEYTLLLPESYSDALVQSLEPFRFKEIFRVPQNSVLSVENLVLPHNPSACEQYNPRVFKELRSFYQQQVVYKTVNIPTGKKIYISREKAKTRKVENELEVFTVLEQEGFIKINFEDLDFWQQVAIMQQATHVVSIHGAGLSNILFMNPGSAVLELQKKKINPPDFFSSVYYTLASVLEIKYAYQFCDPTDASKTIFEADILVDLTELKKNLALLG